MRVFVRVYPPCAPERAGVLFFVNKSPVYTHFPSLPRSAKPLLQCHLRTLCVWQSASALPRQRHLQLHLARRHIPRTSEDTKEARITMDASLRVTRSPLASKHSYGPRARGRCTERAHRQSARKCCGSRLVASAWVEPRHPARHRREGRHRPIKVRVRQEPVGQLPVHDDQAGGRSGRLDQRRRLPQSRRQS